MDSCSKSITGVGSLYRDARRTGVLDREISQDDIRRDNAKDMRVISPDVNAL